MGFYSAGLPSVLAGATVDSIVDAVRRLQKEEAVSDAAIARKIAEVDRAVREGLVDLDINFNGDSQYVYSQLPGGWDAAHALLSPESREIIKQAAARAKAEREKADAKKAADKAARDAEVEREKLAAAAVDAQFVHDHMDANAQARHAAGVLPEDELTKSMEELLFAPLTNESRYVPLTADDVEHAENANTEYNHDAQFDVDDCETLTAAQWSRKTALEAALPGATVTVRDHTAVCEDSDCTEYTHRTGYQVAVTGYGRTFTREYAEV